jgi:hypothetical protein
MFKKWNVAPAAEDGGHDGLVLNQLTLHKTSSPSCDSSLYKSTLNFSPPAPSHSEHSLLIAMVRTMVSCLLLFRFLVPCPQANQRGDGVQILIDLVSHRSGFEGIFLWWKESARGGKSCW